MPEQNRQWARKANIALGLFFVGLGILGAILPLMPTTVFLLVAAWFFQKSSPELYQKLLDHKVLGLYIRSYRLYRAMPLRAKFISLSMMWATLGYSMHVVPQAGVRVLLAAIGLLVSGYILTMDTLTPEMLEACRQEFARKEAEARRRDTQGDQAEEAPGQAADHPTRRGVPPEHEPQTQPNAPLQP